MKKGSKKKIQVQPPSTQPKNRSAKNVEEGTRASYAAGMCQQGGKRYFQLKIPIDDLFNWCFVDRRDENPRDGFQRALDEKRANDIAEHLEAGGLIVNNAVLSAQADAHFEYDSSSKTISFDRTKHAFLVIDGQHRLWGFEKCSIRTNHVPVTICTDLTRAEEARLFVEINTKQKGVHAALLLDIQSVAETETARSTMLRAIYDQFAESDNSPFYGRTSPTGSAVNKLSRLTFNRAIGPALSSGRVASMDVNDRYKLLRNYLGAWDGELENKALLIKSAFLGAVMDVMDDVLDASVTQHGNVKEDSIAETVRPMAKLNYAASGNGGQATKKTMVATMREAMRSRTAISKEMLG